MPFIKLNRGCISLVCVLFFVSEPVSSTICCGTWWWCSVAFWEEWAPWSPCSHSCAGGIRTRVRVCSLNTGLTQSQSSSCAETCFNGGVFEGGKCVCPPLSTGVCCEYIPVCSPICQNGGSCIAHNTCRCTSKFYGAFCEIGVEIEDRLLPKFSPEVTTTYHPLSWYDDHAMYGSNRICYIKINVENAYFDTVLTAVSRQADNHSKYFGNFTTAPVDQDLRLNQSSRFACLKVRCPGTAPDGSLFDTDIDVTVQSDQRTCSVKSSIPLLDIKTMTKYLEGNDAISVKLEAGKNYGEVYGVYMAMGFRDKAEYLAKQSCFSGSIYKQNLLRPDVNVLAKFQCE